MPAGGADFGARLSSARREVEAAVYLAAAHVSIGKRKGVTRGRRASAEIAMTARPV
jgi:hypothetical protein